MFAFRPCCCDGLGWLCFVILTFLSNYIYTYIFYDGSYSIANADVGVWEHPMLFRQITKDNLNLFCRVLAFILLMCIKIHILHVLSTNDNKFCDFLFASLEYKALPTEVQLFEERICYSSNFFPL